MEAEAWVRSEGSGNAVTSVDRVKVPSFKWSMSFAMFNNQFDALAEHSNWTVWEKAVDTVHSIPAEAMFSPWGLLQGLPAGCGMPSSAEWHASVRWHLGRPSLSWMSCYQNLPWDGALCGPGCLLPRLDVLHGHDVSVDLRYHVPQQGEDRVPLWSLQTQSCACRHMKDSGEMVLASCGRAVMAQLEGPLGVWQIA